MDTKTLLSKVLSLNETGWKIRNAQLREADQVMEVELKYRRGGPFTCPECGRSSRQVYDHYERTWRHKDLGDYQTILKASVPRIYCKNCDKVIMIKVPWADKMMRITNRFARQLVNGCILMPISDVCRLFSVSWYTVCRALERTIEKLQSEKVYEGIRFLGIDEIAIRKGHDYLTLVYDVKRSEVIWIGRDRSYETVKAFVAWFGEDRFHKVESICCDMWDPYIKAIREYHHESAIVFDKFHIKKHLNDALDKVRKKEHRELTSQGDDLLKKTKYIWLKNPSNLTRQQYLTFKELRKKKLKSLRAYELKELFNHFWEYVNPTCAERFFNDWYWVATHSRLSPLKKVAKMLKKYWYGIISYITNPLTNSLAEGINSKIRVFTKRAYGFKTFGMLRNIIFLGCGGLNINPFNS